MILFSDRSKMRYVDTEVKDTAHAWFVAQPKAFFRDGQQEARGLK
jgi:hypothetical protein